MQMPVFQIRRHAPMSNVERQREFRRRNPDYNRRYKAAQRARSKAWLEAYRAAQAVPAAVPAPPVVLMLPAPKPLLMLPAPVEDPMMAALDALAESIKSRAAAEALPIPADRASL